MTHLFLEAQDVWLFRDGRPFDAGSAHRAESLFPPYPTTIQGAVRSHQLVLKNVPLTNQAAIARTVGKALTFSGKLDLKGLTLRGPFVARRAFGQQVERYFPLPADAYFQGDGRARVARLESSDGKTVSALHRWLLLPGADAGKPRGRRWLTLSELETYFTGEPVNGLADDDLFQRENRYGIGRNADWVAQEGMLYEAEFIRPCKDTGLLLEMSGYDDPGWQSGMMQLGGESRAARYSLVQTTPWPVPSLPLPPRFRIYFATPAYFSSGVQPPKWSDFFEGTVNLLTIALHGYESVGGFDWAEKDPQSASAHRPARRYVPAGSVYYFENVEGGKLKTSNNAITEFGAEIGFGQFILFPV